MRNVITVFVLVDANERYREVPCIKCTRACHHDVSQPDLTISFLSISEFETFLSEYKKLFDRTCSILWFSGMWFEYTICKFLIYIYMEILQCKNSAGNWLVRNKNVSMQNNYIRFLLHPNKLLLRQHV